MPGQIEMRTGDRGVASAADPAVATCRDLLSEGPLSPEAFSGWLRSEEGRAWVAQQQRLADSSFTARTRVGIPGLISGVAALLGAEGLADVIGLQGPHERFAVVIAAVRGMEIAGQKAWEVGANRYYGRPFDFARKEVVRAAEGEATRLVYESRASAGRAVGAAIAGHFAGSTAKGMAKSVALAPFEISMGMGLGIACSKVTDVLVGSDLSPESREWLSFGAFFAPDVARIVAGERGKALAGKAGLGLVGRLFGAGFLVDFAAMGIQRLVWGDQASYRRSVEMRVAERALNDQAAADAWLLTGARRLLGFVAPVATSMARGIDVSADSSAPQYEFQIIESDREDARQMRKSLPEQILSVLIHGVDDERDDPAFYERVDLGALREEVEETEGSDEAALMRINARNLQQTLASLRFIRLPENEPFVELVDDDGALRRGGEGRLLSLAFSGLNAELARDQVLELRRMALLARIFDAGDSQSPKLTAFAFNAGLADAGGQLIRDARYFTAVRAWKADQGPERQRAVAARREVIRAEASSERDVQHKADLYAELLILDGKEGILSGRP